MNRRVIGSHELQAIVGEEGLAMAATLSQTSPTLSHALVNFAFGEIISRAELSRRERELATISMLTLLGDAESQLRTHLEAALRCGIDQDELIALIEHTVVYAGFPRALNALQCVSTILQEQGMTAILPTHRIWLGDHETLVTDTGGAEAPLLLIHALGVDRRMWREMIPVLAPTRRIIAYDLRGHGHAIAAPHPLTLERFADDVRVLLDMLELNQVDIAGLALGGAIAQQFILAHPERVRSLALICTMASPSPAYLARAEAAEHEGMAAQIGSTLARWFTPQALARNDWSVRYARERVLRARIEDWSASWRALANINTLDRLGSILQPVQVIAGELDLATPPSQMKKLADRLSNATFHVVPKGPHMLSLERPDDLAHVLLAERS